MPDSRLPKVRSRKEFMDYLGGEISAPRDGDGEPPGRGGLRELRAYVIEANAGIPRSGRSAGVGWKLTDTGVDKIKIMRICAGDAACEFYADTSDKRFCVLHTAARPGDADRAVAAITCMDGLLLDRAWLPDPLLRALAKKSGGGALRGFGARYAGGLFGDERPRSLEDLDLSINGSMACELDGHMRRDPRLAGAMAYGKIRLVHGVEAGPSDYIHDEIGRDGCIAVKRGRSVRDHLHMVDAARDLYAAVIGGIEECRPGSTRRNGEQEIAGEPLYFAFEKPLQDTRRFIDRLLDSARPFRLWGLESEIDDGYYNVAGMDLHTGDPMNFEIAAYMMRVYLSEVSGGSTVMRLLCNLQDCLGALVRCRQVEQLAC